MPHRVPLRRPRLVLFDLDGTLADTAADLGAAANRCRQTRGLAELPLGELRPYASQGARGLLQRALGLAPGDPDYEPARVEFLAHYETALHVHSQLFPGLAEALAQLDAAGLAWGVVTNKIERYTLPLVAHLGLSARAACIVGGDTTPFAKPHPAPVLHALQVAGVQAHQAVFIGDDRRDVEAGRAAGTQTAAAAYGYVAADDDPGAWGADHRFASPDEVLQWVRRLGGED